MDSINLGNYWDKGISYAEYKNIIEIQANEGVISKNEEIKKYAEYTRLNLSRIHRNDKTLVLRIFFRDEDESLINQYLTNGGKAIPIVLFIEPDTFQEIAHWGPRPKPCTPFLKKYKSDPDNYTHDDFAKDIQGFYNKDKGRTISEELLEILLK